MNVESIKIYQQNMKWEFLKILNMGSISFKKHDIEILANPECGINIFQQDGVEILEHLENGINIFQKN